MPFGEGSLGRFRLSYPSIMIENDPQTNKRGNSLSQNSLALFYLFLCFHQDKTSVTYSHKATTLPRSLENIDK